MTTKSQLQEFCKTHVNSRISRIQNDIDNIQESLASETKSSAGDKHETGRAMLQLEREKLGQQLMEAEKMALILTRISITYKAKTIVLGSWVKTSQSEYFLSVSAGKFDTENEPIYCISGATPIGQLLLGKSIGDVISFNDEKIRIKEIQ
jgi:transcription elongation GreA/GreB family factor